MSDWYANLGKRLVKSTKCPSFNSSRSFVESPNMLNIYHGNATLDEKGEA